MELNKKYEEMIKRYNAILDLQKFRNADFPNNTIYLCKNNLSFFIQYANRSFSHSSYSPKLDTILVTHILNYLSSYKSYLNRKKRNVECIKATRFKKEILHIIEKYLTPGRSINTDVDKLVALRNFFEHEKIDNIKMQTTILEDRVEKSFYYKDNDLIKLFNDAYRQLEVMNTEIENYIGESIKLLNLGEIAMFLNAFNKFYNKPPFTSLSPVPTEEEIKFYDNLIVTLSSHKDS